jgi:hypothetical protein
MVRSQGVNSKSKPRRRTARRSSGLGRLWSGNAWIFTILGGLIVLLGVVAFVARGSDVLAGEIVPEYTEYDFGEVAYDGGIISTQFPLRALDPAQITKIQTT